MMRFFLLLLQLCTTFSLGLKSGLRHRHHSSPLDHRLHQDEQQVLSSNNKEEQEDAITMTEPCLLVTRVDRGSSTTPKIQCQLQGRDSLKYGPLMLNIPNMTLDWAQTHNVSSGHSTLFWKQSPPQHWKSTSPQQQEQEQQDAMMTVDHKHSLQVDNLDSLQIVTKPHRRLISSTGTKRTLVVRVQSNDGTTTSSEDELRNYIFGTNGDPVNLQSQYRDCSNGALDIVPATQGNGVNNGIKTVTINRSTNNRNEQDVQDDVTAKLEQELGDFSQDYDLVMLCLPRGTNGGNWVGYAYVDHYLSVYLDEWCDRPSSAMHEVGHNLALGHSGETATYDDNSGMMGYAYYDNDGPRMCFNAVKLYQLGWYSEGHVDITTNNWDGYLTGFADYVAGDKCILRIFDKGGDDYYVSFNAATGKNIQVKEGANQVLVHKRRPGLDYADSTLVAKLSNGGSFNGPGGFRVEVNQVSFFLSGGSKAQVRVST